MSKKVLVFDEESDSYKDLLESLQIILKNEKPEFIAVANIDEFKSALVNSKMDVVLVNFQTEVFWDMKNGELGNFVKLIKSSQEPSCIIGGVTGYAPQRELLEKHNIRVGRKNYDRSHLKGLLGVIDKPITLVEIESLVCEYFHVEQYLLHTKKRKRATVQARQVTMYLAKLFIKKLSLKSIGEYFEGRDHTTVIHSCQTVKDLMDTDEEFRFQILELIEKILYSHQATEK